jgi:hypothetical protein
MQILLIGPRQLTKQFATALLNVEQEDGKLLQSQDDLRRPSCLSERVDAHAIAALQRQNERNNVHHHHHLLSHPTDVGLQRKKQQQLIHVQIQEPPPDTDVTPTPSSELDHLTKTKRCWDQIIWITSAPACNFSMDKIWERRETQQFFEDAVSHDDLLMQRVSVVVSMMAIGTGCDATETLWMGGVAAAAAAFAASKDQSTTPQPQQQQQPPLFIQDEPMMIAIETTGATTPTTNRDNNAASDVAIGTSSAAATTTTELAKHRPQRRQKGHERHRLFHHALVSTFFFHPPETSSLRSCARLLWKKCLVAQRIRYPGCSPLLLTTTKQHQQLDQLKQSSRKRKLGKCV